jgi:hypothetical protein
MLRYYKQVTKSVVRQFYTGGCEDRTPVQEADEFRPLEAIAREWLVITQQAGKDLTSAVVIRELWRLAVAL